MAEEEPHRESRMRINRILDDMQSQIVAIAESHHGTATRRRGLRVWTYMVFERARLINSKRRREYPG